MWSISQKVGTSGFVLSFLVFFLIQPHNDTETRPVLYKVIKYLITILHNDNTTNNV